MEFSYQPLFTNRIEAGRKLGELLSRKDLVDPVILALPRGGAVIAGEVAKKMGLGMDVVVARKIGEPDDPEYALGALSEDEGPIYGRDQSQIEGYGPALKNIVSEEREELRRRVQLYRGGRQLGPFPGRTLIVIDDGLATGMTALAAAQFLRTLGPSKLILAVPVAPATPGKKVQEAYDEIITLHSIRNFAGVGIWYEDFTQVDDQEVLSLLSAHHG